FGSRPSRPGRGDVPPGQGRCAGVGRAVRRVRPAPPSYPALPARNGGLCLPFISLRRPGTSPEASDASGVRGGSCMSHRSHGPRRPPALPPLRRLLAMAIAMLITAAILVPSARARTLTGCEVDYTAHQWKTGFTATITVRNIGARLKRWRLEWHFADPGQTVIQGWNGEYVQDGTHVTVTGRPGKASLEAGASLTLGFNGSWSGANPAPTTFELNGITCTRPVPPTPTPRTAPPAPSSGDPWTPPAALAAGLDQVWRHVENTYPDLYGFRNYTWDQVMANGGSINYCVRWESDA